MLEPGIAVGNVSSNREAEQIQKELEEYLQFPLNLDECIKKLTAHAGGRPFLFVCLCVLFVCLLFCFVFPEHACSGSLLCVFACTCDCARACNVDPHADEMEIMKCIPTLPARC